MLRWALQRSWHQYVSANGLMQQVGGIATESASTAVWGLQLDGLDQVRLLVQTMVKYLFDGPVLRRTECKGTSAGRFKPAATVLVAQANDALRCTQVIQNTIAEEGLYERQTSWTDPFGLRQTPLRIAHQVGLGFGREVVSNRRLIALLE